MPFKLLCLANCFVDITLKVFNSHLSRYYEDNPRLNLLRRVLPWRFKLRSHSTGFLVEMYPMTDVRHKQSGFLYIAKMRSENEICVTCGSSIVNGTRVSKRFTVHRKLKLKVVRLINTKSMTNDNGRLLKTPLSFPVLCGQDKQK